MGEERKKRTQGLRPKGIPNSRGAKGELSGEGREEKKTNLGKNYPPGNKCLHVSV